MYVYIVHIEITVHIQVLVYCKKVPTHFIMDLPIIYVPHSTQQKQ